jgi:magnesium-transporting ATPase (P-type)
MVTGDHVRTAISVAHQCHILPVGRPVLLVDGPDPAAAAAGQPGGQASLSVLYPDGSVNPRVPPSTVLAQVGMGSHAVEAVCQAGNTWVCKTHHATAQERAASCSQRAPYSTALALCSFISGVGGWWLDVA